jgi:hypothetical protein
MGEKSDPGRAFDELFTACHSDVLAYIVRRTSLANAEDVLAETFLVAWRRADRVPKDPLPWLLGVAWDGLDPDRAGSAAGCTGGDFPGSPSSCPQTRRRPDRRLDGFTTLERNERGHAMKPDDSLLARIAEADPARRGGPSDWETREQTRQP